MQKQRYPGVAQLGSDASAACGGFSELSEWLRSADTEGACRRRRCRVPQQEARLLWELEHQIGSTAPNVAYSPVYLRNPANTAVESWAKLWYNFLDHIFDHNELFLLT